MTRKASARAGRHFMLALLAAISITGAPAALGQQGPFLVEPASGPIGTRVKVGSGAGSAGLCRDQSGKGGDLVSLFVQQAQGTEVLSAAGYDVGRSGEWDGRFRIPEVHIDGSPVSPGEYILEADCEFEDDFDAEFTFPVQRFTVTPGRAPECAGGCPRADEVDCVANPAACSATQPPAGSSTANASPSTPSGNPAAQASGTSVAGPGSAGSLPGEAGAEPGSALASGQIPTIELAAPEVKTSAAVKRIPGRKTPAGKADDATDASSTAQVFAALVATIMLALMSGYQLLRNRRPKAFQQPRRGDSGLDGGSPR